MKCSGLKKGCIEIHNENIYPGMIQMSIKGVSGIAGCNQAFLNFSDNGKLIFNGRADLCMGMSINVVEDGVLNIGNNFFMNTCSMIRCRHRIDIGSDNMWGWNVLLMDGDGHPIFNETGQVINKNRPIRIGNNVWLGSYCKILKGSDIQDGCIVGIGSTATRKNPNSNAILAGTPAIEIKNNITWHHGGFTADDR